MKTAIFFLNKAESFNAQLRAVELVPYNRGKKTDNLYQESIGADNGAFNEQKEYLEELKFQMKLMFSEFDNGSLFSEKLNEKHNGIHFDSKAIFSNEPFANYLVDVNHLFIEFLREYRIEEKNEDKA